MTDLKVLVPGPGHPISVDASPARVTVEHAGRLVADTRNALILREATYPPVRYLPLADVSPTSCGPAR